MADEPTENADEQQDEPIEQTPDTPATQSTPTEDAQDTSQQAANDAPQPEAESTGHSADAEPLDGQEVEQEQAVEEPVAEGTVPDEPVADDAVTEAPVAEGSSAEELVAEESAEEEPVAEEAVEKEPVARESAAEKEAVAEEPVAKKAAQEEPVAQDPAVEKEPVAQEFAAEEEPVAQGSAAEEPVAAEAEESSVSEDGADAEEDEEPTPRVKPSVPGAHLEVDIVPEGVDPLAPDQPADPYAVEDYDETQSEDESDGGRLAEPISTAAIDLAAGARYKATGKRKTAVARVILRPGTGAYLVNGHTLDEHFPRVTLQRNIRQPLETVGYQDRMDVVARLHGGGISAQAGALRHGISRALLEADPNLRGELKRRGFLTRDSRAKERKKAGLKKARKRPQFSKR